MKKKKRSQTNELHADELDIELATFNAYDSIVAGTRAAYAKSRAHSMFAHLTTTLMCKYENESN